MERDIIDRIEQLGERHETSVGGSRIVWRRFGSGPDLVLLHGGHGSWLHWIRNVKALSAERTLWLPDMPGFGDSDSISDEGSDTERMQRFVDVLAQSMLSVRSCTQPVDVAAFSFGALSAAMMASHGLVNRLALLGPVGHGGRKPPRAPLATGWSRKGPAERETALRHNLTTLMLDPANLDELAIEIYRRQCNSARFKVKTVVRTAGLLDLLSGFTGPLMIIWGEHDVTGIPTEVGPSIESSRPNTAWQVIKNSGHWVQYEQADAVSSLLKQWFREPPQHCDAISLEARV